MKNPLLYVVLGDLAAVVALVLTGHPVPDPLVWLLTSAGGALGGATIPNRASSSTSSEQESTS